jgi:hypothetical protein
MNRFSTSLGLMLVATLALPALARDACAAETDGAERAAPAPQHTDPRPILVTVHCDDRSLAPSLFERAVGEELGAPTLGPGAPDAATASSSVTITYHPARGELAVTYEDERRGTVTRVVEAPSEPREVPRMAALLAGNLARNEAETLLVPDAPRAAPAPSAANEESTPAMTRSPGGETRPDARTSSGTPTTDDPISVALLFGYGFNDSNAGNGNALNIYGAGVGGRVGYTFGFKGYVGASFVYHTGFDQSVGGEPAHGRVSPFGLELGYALTWKRVSLRPYLGVGLVNYDASYASGASFDEGQGNKPALWPGVIVAYDLLDYVFVGLEGRYTIVSAGGDRAIVGAGRGSADAFGLYGTVGFRIPD